MPILPTPWRLEHEGRTLCTDVEALCRRAIAKARVHLNAQQHERCLSFLLVEAWKLAEKYKPGKASFDTWAQPHLTLDTIDWTRSKDAEAEGLPGRTKWTFSATASINKSYAGRTIELTKPQRVPLDDRMEHRTHDNTAADGGDTDLLRALRTTNSGNTPMDNQQSQEDPRRHAA